MIKSAVESIKKQLIFLSAANFNYFILQPAA
ncbi:hypothetical protein EAVNNN508_00948 [Elizabethkingia anophelis]|nr:hypothetical protein EAVNVB490_01213 [Elizabethkingia anophelis]CAI9670142.1 hypothetical protein EAVNNN508_01213 [Elizabethkingia anophelis]CAI9673583.1 hypothetical protein EAVNVB490_00950 [Elizabethkingia anophelis]CAI9679265.1 hypothetical protein EAVNNN508_00948 [Elizabethkingia anophelis]